jgi:hypothetical protein
VATIDLGQLAAGRGQQEQRERERLVAWFHHLNHHGGDTTMSSKLV